MKKMNFLVCAFALVAVFMGCSAAFASDPYKDMALDLSDGADKLSNRKVAVLPFSYTDGRQSEGSTIVSERLITRIIQMGRLSVVERNLLDKVMSELKLQVSGAINPDSAKELGKILGVEAIVTGTLIEKRNGKVEVNARMIKTETADAIVATSAVLEKDWEDVAPPPVIQQQEAPQYEQPAYKRSRFEGRTAGRGRSYGFFDLFFGAGSHKMNLEFDNTQANITCGSLGLGGPAGAFCNSNNTGYTSFSWDSLKTTGGAPIGFRVGGWGNDIIGGAFEMSYMSRNIAAQDTTFKVNNISRGAFTFNNEDYLTVKTFNLLTGDIMLRIPSDNLEPYFGLGVGLGIGKIDSPFIVGNNTGVISKPLSAVGVGLLARVELGCRIHLGDVVDLFTEGRIQNNTIFFNRGITNENDKLSLLSVMGLFGIGFRF